MNIKLIRLQTGEDIIGDVVRNITKSKIKFYKREAVCKIQISIMKQLSKPIFYELNEFNDFVDDFR